MGALRFVAGMFECLQATLGVGAYRVLPGRGLGVGVPSAQTTDRTFTGLGGSHLG